MHRFFYKLLYACIFLLSTWYSVNAQTAKLDSLKQIQVSNSVEDRKKIIMGICERFNSFSADTLFKYLDIGFSLFPHQSRSYIRLRNFYSTGLFRKGKLKEGLALSDTLLPLAKQGKYIDSIGVEILSNRAGGLIRDGQNKEAMELCFNMLREVEPIHDTMGMIKVYTLLGWANMELEQSQEAIRWLEKAVAFSYTWQMAERGAVVYANIASCYNNIGKTDSASYYIEQAIRHAVHTENLSTLANSLNIRADIYLNKKDYTRAEKDMKDALEVRQKIGDPLYVISDMAQLSSFYASINETGKGIAIANQGIELARKHVSNTSKLIFLYSGLAENYRKAGLTNEYSVTLEQIIRLKDSLNTGNSRNAIAEMEAKYDLQKKENIIIKQKYDLTRSRYLNIGASILFVLGLLLVFLLYRNYRLVQKRKMVTALAEQKLIAFKEIEMAKESERKRIAADLHDNLGSYAAAITANVKYLKDNEGNEDEMILSQLDGNAQNMVTQLGDTIWVLKNEYLPITKLADRFKSWMMRMMQNYPHIKYHYRESIIDDIEFTPSKILHIFLILKECVNNAVKHSDCTEIWIGFFSEDDWYITIQDNGKGIDASNGFERGSGINNIRNRANECNWEVEWKKVVPFGTKVVISESTTN